MDRVKREVYIHRKEGNSIVGGTEQMYPLNEIHCTLKSYY